MKILFNFSFLKSGGGQNVALNFLSSLEINNQTYFFLVVKDSLIHKYLLKENNSNFKVVNKNPIVRMFWELLYGNRFIIDNNIQIIYTYFGYSLFPKKIPQVIGAADSNLFFPKIKFWNEYKGVHLLIKKMIDFYRVYGLKNANAIIFENSLLESKCHKLFKIKGITTTILPSINLMYNQKFIDLNKRHRNILSNAAKGLYLCSWQRHKGIMLIPEIASILKNKGILFNFILTAPKDMSKMHLEFEALTKKYKVTEYVSIIGSVNKNQLKSLYNQIDIVFLLSTLESFSNNIVEAWAYKKPLLISDEEWARGLCSDAAFYVNRTDTNLICNSIENILNDNKSVLKIIQNGKSKLNELNTIEVKTSMELSFINKVFKNHQNV